MYSEMDPGTTCALLVGLAVLCASLLYMVWTALPPSVAEQLIEHADGRLAADEADTLHCLLQVLPAGQIVWQGSAPPPWLEDALQKPVRTRPEPDLPVVLWVVEDEAFVEPIGMTWSWHPNAYVWCMRMADASAWIEQPGYDEMRPPIWSARALRSDLELRQPIQCVFWRRSCEPLPVALLPHVTRIL
jgi:hypothetical protein